MVTETQQQMARREYWIDTFGVALNLEDDPFGVHHQGDLEAMADQALIAEAGDQVETHTWLVIRFRKPGQWGYEAKAIDEVPHGCVHTTRGVSTVHSQLAALTEHRAGMACREVR